MQYTALLLAATAATASAQVTYNSTTGTFTCPKENPNGAYCAGDSLATNIIIRCVNGVGQPGNCNDNLAGYFPYGVNYAPCWQTSTTSGDAACSKNCIVEGSSGNYNGTFTLPDCTPVPTPSSTTTTVTSTTSSSSKASSTGSTTSTIPTSSASKNTASITTTTTFVPPSNTTTTVGPTGSSTRSSNTTITTITTGTATGSATNTPVGPSGTTTAAPTSFTGAAIANSAPFSLAVVGIFAAYFL